MLLFRRNPTNLVQINATRSRIYDNSRKRNLTLIFSTLFEFLFRDSLREIQIKRSFAFLWRKTSFLSAVLFVSRRGFKYLLGKCYRSIVLIAESNVLRTWLRSAHANFALHSARGKPAALSACFVRWLLAAKLHRADATGCTLSASPDSNIFSMDAINTP